MALPLMPKATAVWLVENTALTFDQIAEFCGLHPLEVKALADDEVGIGIIGSSPILNGELTAEEIERCEKTTNARLKILKNDLPKPRSRSKGPRYTPVSKRGDKPNAILFLTKKYPDLTDPQICRLIGTTKPTVASVKDKTYPTYATLKPQDPVVLGLCTLDEMTKAVQKVERKKERERKAVAKAARAAGLPAPPEAAPAEVSLETTDAQSVDPTRETGT